jgi:trans-L-3-hydroxyproline dehydratase
MCVLKNQFRDEWMKIRTVDAHAAGEPLRVVIEGVDPIPGGSILEKRRFAREHLDGLRRTLMFEPRGHADMYGALITEPVTKNGDLGVLFMHNEGWSTMCGHGIIALVTVTLETNIIKRTTKVKLDTPAGLVTAHATLDAERVRKVAFENVPSFTYALDKTVDIPNIGRVRYDIAFGGAFYAFVEANDLGVELTPPNFRELIRQGMAVKEAVMKSHPIRHPYEEDLSFLYGTIITGPPHSPDAHSRNVCIFADGEVDRSPTGTGVSGRLALEQARGRLGLNEPFIVESILGTRFTGTIVGQTKLGPYDAIIPRVEGSAWITGKHEFLIAPDDPIREGFILR